MLLEDSFVNIVSNKQSHLKINWQILFHSPGISLVHDHGEMYFNKQCNLGGQQTITLKMVDQGRSDFYVVLP